MIQEATVIFFVFYYIATGLIFLIFNLFLFKKAGYLFFLTPPSFLTNSFFVMVMLWPVEVEVIGQLDYFFRSCLLASFAVQTISIAAYLKLTPQTQYKNFMLQNEPVVDSSTTQNLVIFLLFATLLTVFVAIIFADTVGFSF